MKLKCNFDFKFKNPPRVLSCIFGFEVCFFKLEFNRTCQCPSNKQGPGTRTTPGCYPGSDFLQNQIASDPGLAQEANWDDVTALVGTMADQIVAGIC